MRPSSTSTAGEQIGIGIALVFFVTLVTFVFSFLGTILAGALVGMMVGFARQWKWQFILVSLVFPAALMASMHVSKNTVSLRDSLSLSLVCFGVFWLTCLLTRGVALLERRETHPSGERAGARLKPGHAAKISAARLAVPIQPPADSGLDELQGTWTRDTTAPDGKPCKKVIEIAHGELALSLIDRAGKVRFLAKGDLALEKFGTFKMVKVSHRETGPAGFSAEELGLPGKWIYRVAGDNLTVAVDLEETVVAGRQPIMETYVKSRER